MKDYLDNLKTWALQNPAQALAAGFAAMFATSKLMQANTERQNAQAWSQEVKRRSMKDATK